MQGFIFKKRLRDLGRTQVGFASEIGVSERTVHNWAASGPPGEIVYLLDLLIRLERPLGPSGTARDEFNRAVEAELDRLWADATGRALGIQLVRIVGRWVARRQSAITSADAPDRRTGRNRAAVAGHSEID